LQWAQVEGPDGFVAALDSDQMTDLFDTLELGLATVTFAMQAIESFCNEIIGEKLVGTLALRRQHGIREMAAPEVERYVSTTEKLASVLPQLLGRPSAKGTPLWLRFRNLRQLRDEATHTKSTDQTPVRRNTERFLPRRTLISELLDRDLSDCPRIAVDMMMY
jgi:hypothetical protein